MNSVVKHKNISKYEYANNYCVDIKRKKVIIENKKHNIEFKLINANNNVIVPIRISKKIFKKKINKNTFGISNIKLNEILIVSDNKINKETPVINNMSNSKTGTSKITVAKKIVKTKFNKIKITKNFLKNKLKKN